ncbi:MAG: glycosyltransferase family 9 protein [Acidobacteriota bacterium]
MKSEASSSPNAADTPVDWSRVQSVLLIRLRSIGDTVLMTPCLTALKEWRPNLEIAVMLEPLAAPLLEDHPLVDKLIIARKSVASRVSVIARLRRARFDVAFNMHGGSTSAILARLSGAKHSIGYRGLPLSRLLTDRPPSPDVVLERSRIHSSEQQLALLKWSGVPWPASRPRSSLVVSADARARVRERLQAACDAGWNGAGGGGFACIVPGAAFESKMWTAEGFARVADHLTERWSLPSVVVAGPGQERLAREVASAANAKTTVLAGLGLKELVALLETARLFVGNDSGPMHIAAALECPVVAVFGSSNPDVWHPWTGAAYRVLGGERGTADSNVRGSIDTVRVSEVIAAVDEVLQSAATRAAS